MDYNTEQFYYYLDECYFHPERDKKFASDTEKKLARKAMELLWNKESFKVNDITYSNEEIRTKLLDEMMLGLMVGQTVIAMASLLTSPMLQYGNTEICFCDLISMQIILKKSEL